MTTRYDEPNRTARAANALFRWLAEAGISVAGTRALRVRGRKTGKLRGVVINLMTVDGRDFVVSPRGNTQWARNARAAGEVEIGPRWRSREVGRHRGRRRRQARAAASATSSGGTGRSRDTSAA